MENMTGINIEEVKKYNSLLKQYKEALSRVQTEIDLNKQLFNQRCEQLSKELGIVVNQDNIEEILKERVEKIKNTMDTGKEILNRIRAEEQSVNTERSNNLPMNNGYNTQTMNSMGGQFNQFTGNNSDMMNKLFGGNI